MTSETPNSSQTALMKVVLPAPNFSIEGEDGIVAHFSDELAGGFMNLV